MLGQCTNPSPPCHCPFCLHPFKKSKFHSNVAVAGPGYTKGAQHSQVIHFLTICGVALYARHLPLKGIHPAPFFPSPTLILPLWVIHYSLPDLLPKGEKRCPSLPFISPLGRPLLPQRPPFTPQPPLIGRLTPLLSIRTSHLSPPSTPTPSSCSSILSSSSSSLIFHSHHQAPPTFHLCLLPSYDSFHSLTPHTQHTSCVILQFNCNGILHCMQ